MVLTEVYKAVTLRSKSLTEDKTCTLCSHFHANLVEVHSFLILSHDYTVVVFSVEFGNYVDRDAGIELCHGFAGFRSGDLVIAVFFSDAEVRAHVSNSAQFIIV
jgi:hypothetical protein